MNPNVASFLQEWLAGLGLSNHFIGTVSYTIVLGGIFLLAFLADLITKKVLISIIAYYVRKSENTYDDIILEKKVFNRLSHIAPAAVVYYLIHLAFHQYPGWISTFQSLTAIFIVIISVLVADSFIDAMHEIYNTLPISKERHIKGYVQVVKMIVLLIGGIFVLSIIFNKPAIKLLTGLGASVAILMLVFKDTIVGLVSSIQLSANDMVKIGDWIQMPKNNIDGTVIEISLNTVKVRNWDNTISTVPTYSLVSDSFYNWKGMEKSGARRIKRAFFIDLRSVRLANKELIDKLTYNHLIPASFKADKPLAGVKISNLGLFRKYLEGYLLDHPDIHKGMAVLVRDLEVTEMGIPLEITAFTNKTDASSYESIQSEVTEHILVILPEFGLRIFQVPSGEDLSVIHHIRINELRPKEE
jgi:miniconductance mechanosensitive channel